jgi:hypothetical protein
LELQLSAFAAVCVNPMESLRIPQHISQTLRLLAVACKIAELCLPFSESLWTFDLSFSRSTDILMVLQIQNLN